MNTSTATSVLPEVSDSVRFVAARLSTGHFGVFDTLFECYVVRDVTDLFAQGIADRLNRPHTWRPTPDQLVADTVRHILKCPTPRPLTPLH